MDGDQRRELLLLEGIVPAYRALGGLSAHGSDFLLSYSLRTGDSLGLHLTRFNTQAEVVWDRVIEQAEGLDFDPDYVFRAYHAPLDDKLLLGWHSNDQLMLALADPDSGQLVEAPVAAPASIDRFVEFTPRPDGGVGWGHADAAGHVSVTRVLACSD